mgnify:CR=1 FL=1
MRYQKKPEFIEAVQWTAEPHNFWEIQKLCSSSNYAAEWRDDDCLIIHIGCDKAYVLLGDYIVKNSVGAVCCWDKNRFEEKYELSETEDVEAPQECEAVAVEPCWQERMQAEYHDLKTRYEKLHRMVTKYEAGTLDFTPNCSIDMLRQQKRHMGEYLHDLEIRAEIEGVEL